MKKMYSLLLVLLMAMTGVWATNYDVKYEFVYYDYPTSTNWDSEKLAELFLEEDAFTINLEALNKWKSVKEGTNVIFRWDGSQYFALESIRYGKAQTKVTNENSIAVQVTSENVNQQGQFEVRVFVRHKYLVPKTDNSNTYCYQAYGSYTGQNGDQSWGRPVLPMDEWWSNTYMEYPAKKDWYVYYTSTAKAAGQFECWVPAKWITASSNEASAKARLTTEQNAVSQSSIEYQIYQKFRSASFKITADEWEKFVEICGVSANPNNSLESLLTMRPVFKAKPDFEVIALHGEIYCTYGGTLTDSNDTTWYYTVPPTGDKQIQLGIRNVEDGWQFDHWTFNGTSVSTATLKTFDLTGNAYITAEFTKTTPVTPTYYKVFVVSEHGTVYDVNGEELSSYQGDPCFYADGTLKLAVSDIDDGWEFDHWELDGTSKGSSTYYEYTPTEDNHVVTAVYKEEETPVTPPAAQRYVVVARSGNTANWYYMLAEETSTSTKRYVAESTGTNDLSKVVTSGKANKYYWEFETDGDDTYLKSNSSYCYSTSDKSAKLGTYGTPLTIDRTNSSYYQIYYTSGSDDRYLSFNASASSFAFYKSTQIRDLYFLPEGSGSATGIEEVMEAQPATSAVQKVMIDGQIYILRDGKIYNAMGAEVK